MTDRYLWLLVILSLLLGSSCTKVLSVDLPPEEDFLVTYAFLNAEDTVSTVVTDRTLLYLESYFGDQALLEGGATIEVFREDDPAGAFFQREDTYLYDGTHDRLNDTTATYRLRVSHPDHIAMEASARLPRRAGGWTAERLEDYPLPDGTVLASAVAISFRDPAPPGDFYEVLFRYPLFDGQDTIRRLLNVTLDEIRVDDTNLTEDPTLFFFPLRSWFLSDRNFNGQTVRMVFALPAWLAAGDPFFPILRNISKDQFDYISFLAGDEIGLNKPLISNPSAQFNFDNGLGVFAIYREQEVRVE